eukprot:4704739-Pyramimonas_sp.AAC.1
MVCAVFRSHEILGNDGLQLPWPEVGRNADHRQQRTLFTAPPREAIGQRASNHEWFWPPRPRGPRPPLAPDGAPGPR